MSEQQTDKVDYAKLFEKERFEWREKIQIISLNLKNIKTVAEAQVELFSTRQILLEYSFKLAQIVSKLSSRERQTRAAKLKDYNQNSDVRYGSNETKVLIEGDVAEIVGKIEMVEGHRKFIDQTIQTVDHMLYGIKSRIALEDYLRGSTIK
jgi:flagellar basal body rod protein FlgC